MILNASRTCLTSCARGLEDRYAECMCNYWAAGHQRHPGSVAACNLPPASIPQSLASRRVRRAIGLGDDLHWTPF